MDSREFMKPTVFSRYTQNVYNTLNPLLVTRIQFVVTSLQIMVEVEYEEWL